MTRVHDMGGRFGDGPVDPTDRAYPPRAEPWQTRALTLTLAAGATGLWNIDMSRRAREAVDPKDYARFSYYEKWLAGMADLLVETGAVSREELASAGEGLSQCDELDPKALRAEAVPGVLARGGPADRDSAVMPVFSPGDAVMTLRPAANRLVDGGHTRLPAYAAGARGRVLRCHGAHVLPDSNAHGLGEAPEPLYAVAFAASELWAAPEHPRDEVVLDLWQSYLCPA
ncbi:nitrile hydratase subunit beta [Marinibacterium profundimaris]|uniref:nitrile hydratase n=1 Tax=Marinibacterium profundimaris TaxID=1679460 RepID=A0A225NGG6_9RHOB|nr:nitrile hydratase subunit beta [Marinibacterium profundimaris]OWU72587.1 nitrile hydratase [Marinibacterium profundimaris]